MPDPTDKRALFPADLLLSAICVVTGIDVMGADRYGPAREACERAIESIRAPEAEGGCIKSPFVSRMCERGTRGCDVRHDAPSEEGEGPEALIADRTGLNHEPADIAEFLDAQGDRASAATGESLYAAADVVRGLASRLQSAERRIAELEVCAERYGALVATMEQTQARVAELEAQAADERRIANEHLAARHDAEKRIAELEADVSRLTTERNAGRIAYDKLADDHRALRDAHEAARRLLASEGPTLFVNFNAQGAAIDVFHERDQAERRPGHGDIREYVPAVSAVGPKAQLIAAFVPEPDRAACARHPLARVVQHAIEHHQWHHEAQDSVYVASVEAERDAAVKRAEEAERIAYDRMTHILALTSAAETTKRDLEQARAALDESRTVTETILGLGVLNLVDHGITKPRAEALLERLSAMHDEPARLDADREEERAKCGTCGDRRVLPGCPADCSCDLLRRECRVERPCPDCDSEAGKETNRG